MYEIFEYYSLNSSSQSESTTWKDTIEIQNKKYTFSDFIMLLLSYINTTEELNYYTENILYIKHLHQQTIYFIIHLLTLPLWNNKIFNLFNEIFTKSLVEYNEKNCVSIYSIFTNTINNIITYGTIVKYYNRNNNENNNNNNNNCYGVVTDIKYNKVSRSMNSTIIPVLQCIKMNDFSDIIFNNEESEIMNLSVDLYNIIPIDQSNCIDYKINEDFALLLFEHFPLLFDENQKYILFIIFLKIDQFLTILNQYIFILCIISSI